MDKDLKLKKRFVCDYCDRSFEFKCILKKHVDMHTSQKDKPRLEGLTCTKCNLVFKNKGLLVCHNLKIHGYKRSQLENRFVCDYCYRSFGFKCILKKHVDMHTSQKDKPRLEGLTCTMCNLVFKNKGLLVCHNLKIHGYKSEPPKVIDNKYRHICQACQINFFFERDLKNHIREHHFNLLSQIPYCDLKKVNQVWFEKVLNSSNIVEIKKIAENTLVMRKLDDNTAMKVSEHKTEVIDLHDLYPTQRSKNIQCEYCLKSYDRVYINKHINDVHLKYNDKGVVTTEAS